jgi:transcriptional regulator with XRE-family HTH domain
VGRTIRELREAKGLTYRDLAYRMNRIMESQIEEVLREQGRDMRGAWRDRDVLLERVRVRPETVERWEKVGFGVEVDTRAAHRFYTSPAFVALIQVLDADVFNDDDFEDEMDNRTLQPGDMVTRPLDEEGYPTFGEGVTHASRYLVLPDGFGGTFLKDVRDVTEADREAIKTYLEEEAAFLAAEREKLIDTYVQSQNLDDVIRRLLGE